MRPISFSLIALFAIACEPTTLETDSLESGLLEADLRLPQYGEEGSNTLVGPTLPYLDPYVDPTFEPEFPEIETEQDEPESEVTDLEDPIGENDDVTETTETAQIKCGVHILKPKSLELHAGEELLVDWQAPVVDQKSQYIGVVLDNGDERKLVQVDGMQGTAIIELPTDLALGRARLYLGAEKSRQSWFCNDSSHFEIVP